MDLTSPILYCVRMVLECSSRCDDANRVLDRVKISIHSFMCSICFEMALIRVLLAANLHGTSGRIYLRPDLLMPRMAHLMSAMSAECRTRPQYVDRSYLELGNGLSPGKEDDILFIFLCAVCCDCDGFLSDNSWLFLIIVPSSGEFDEIL